MGCIPPGWARLQVPGTAHPRAGTFTGRPRDRQCPARAALSRRAALPARAAAATLPRPGPAPAASSPRPRAPRRKGLVGRPRLRHARPGPGKQRGDVCGPESGNGAPVGAGRSAGPGAHCPPARTRAEREVSASCPAYHPRGTRPQRGLCTPGNALQEQARDPISSPSCRFALSGSGP